MGMKTFLLAAMGSAAFAAPAGAVSFYVWDYGVTGTNAAAARSFDVALDYWSSVLSDDLVVNLQLAPAAMGPGLTSLTYSTYNQASYGNMNQVYAALAADSKTTLDAQAVANLPTLTPGNQTATGSLTVTINGMNEAGTAYVDETTQVDNNGSGNNSYTMGNSANIRAMGLEAITGVLSDDTLADGVIFFSTNVKWDYDPTDGIDSGSFDFTGIAIREIGQMLGLESQIWVYDENTEPGQIPPDGAYDATVTAKPLDLFRYSGSDVLDWSTSETNKYFSIDGGETALFGNASFRTGQYTGDGADARYWKDNADGTSGGIMDADPGTGTGMSVSALDLAALDAIGWDLNFDILGDPGYRRTTADIYAAMTAVPEPSTWLQMLTGFGLIGAVARRRRPKMMLA